MGVVGVRVGSSCLSYIPSRFHKTPSEPYATSRSPESIIVSSVKTDSSPYRSARKIVRYLEQELAQLAMVSCSITFSAIDRCFELEVASNPLKEGR